MGLVKDTIIGIVPEVVVILIIIIVKDKLMEHSDRNGMISD